MSSPRPQKHNILRLGTRGSPLALVQANYVRSLLLKHLPDLDVIIHTLHTSGDNAPYIEKNLPLQDIGGKGLFTKEIETALLDQSIDLAVHSYKDMATIGPYGLQVGAVLERCDPRDVFLSPSGLTLNEMPPGSRIGTSSLRRLAQLNHLYPTLVGVPLRGNVQTRLQKMEKGECDGTILAAAGLKRLGLFDSLPKEVLPLETWIPAPAQGALALQCRTGDTQTLDLIAPLNHIPTDTCVQAERSFLRSLDGNCRTPIAAYGHIQGNELHLHGMYLPQGSTTLKFGSLVGDINTPGDLGRQLGEQMGQQLNS